MLPSSLLTTPGQDMPSPEMPDLSQPFNPQIPDNSQLSANPNLASGSNPGGLMQMHIAQLLGMRPGAARQRFLRLPRGARPKIAKALPLQALAPMVAHDMAKNLNFHMKQLAQGKVPKVERPPKP